MKVCSKCQITKELECFNKRGDSNNYRSHCKQCVSIKHKSTKVYSKRVLLTPDQRRVNTLTSYKKHNSKRKDKQACYEANRRARKLQATPPWLTETHYAAIAANYELAKILSDAWDVQMDVDHIVPLRGKNVCGLHVPWNLQVMVHSANCTKSNKLEDING